MDSLHLPEVKTEWYQDWHLWYLCWHEETSGDSLNWPKHMLLMEKKMAEIMYSSHNNWVLKVSGLALVLLYFPLWLVHCAFKHFITIFNWVLKVFRIALVLLWFCFIFLCDWSKKLAPLSQTIRYKTTINLDLVCNIFLIFWAVWLFLRWVQTGF